MAIKRKYLVIIPQNLTNPTWASEWSGYNTCDFIIRADDHVLVFDTPEDAAEYAKKHESGAVPRHVAVLAWEESDGVG